MATIDWRDLPDANGKTWWDLHPDLSKETSEQHLAATTEELLATEKPAPIPEGQIDWRDLPDANGKTYWDLHPDEKPNRRPAAKRVVANGVATTVFLLLSLFGAARAGNDFITNDSSKPIPVTVSAIPTGATAITAASGNVANGSAVATLAGTAGKTTYITGFQATASGATGALVVNVTVGGVVTGTMTYTFTFPAGVTTAAQPLIVPFDRPVPASGTNTAIVVTLPASGAGGTNAAVNAQGFQL